MLATRFGSVTPEPVPTWNVKAPWTGWESADTTRHATTYAPVGSVGTSVATTDPVPPGCAGGLTEISLPLPSNSRIAPSDTSTGSPNVSVICRGGMVRMALASGSVEIS